MNNFEFQKTKINYCNSLPETQYFRYSIFNCNTVLPIPGNNVDSRKVYPMTPKFLKRKTRVYEEPIGVPMLH